jgi:hypothetical protein
MYIEFLAEKYNIKRVYREDCQLCILGYEGKCPYLIKMKGKWFCVREVAKEDRRILTRALKRKVK